MKQIRILIADDHALLRRGLATLLRAHKNISVVGDAMNGEIAVKRAKELKPDIVIMDLFMPVLNGTEATRQIREALPETKVLILTSFGTAADVTRAVRFGASGAIVKVADDTELIKAIHTIAEGGTAFSPEIKAMMRAEPNPPELTPRQLDILKSIVYGLASDAIAEKFGLSTHTVNQHIETIRMKLGAANRAEAVAIALRKHLLKV